MKKIKFRTNSRHISQLGRELVTDFVTAIVELIKNSYDADAYAVKIILDKPNTPDSKLIIVDTGTGMTQNDFVNKWMVIGTNNKVTEPFTPKGRKKAGKKGIGRFSVERIAEKVNIYSFPANEAAFKVNINWNKFEEINISELYQKINILKVHKDVSAAKFICSQIEYFKLTENVENKDKELVSSYFENKEVNYSLFFDDRYIEILKKKIIPILKKYESIEQLVGDVDSSLDILESRTNLMEYELLDEMYAKYNLDKPKTGIVLVMQGLRDQWKQKDIDKLQKELRLLVAPDFIEKDPFKIELKAPDFKIDDMILVNEILDLRYAKITAKVYDNAKRIHISYKDKEGKEEVINEELDEPYLCGNVEAELYYFLRDSKNLTQPGAGYNFRLAQKMLDTYCGIKIYRDSFRVKPYGDIGNDWLLLDQKKVKDTHGYLVGNNQVIGVVKISDINNPLLVDATNREGIIENEAYNQLKDFIIRCTNLISDVRKKEYLEQQNKIKELEKRKEKIDKQIANIKDQYKDKTFIKKIEEFTNLENEKDISSKIDNLIRDYIKDSEKKESDLKRLQKDYNEHYNDTKKIYEDKINFQESELNLYKNLASLGMLTGSFGHETSDIVSRIQTTIHITNIYLDRDMDREEIKELIEVINNDFKRLYAYSSLIVNFLRKRKRKFDKDIEIVSVLKEVCKLYKNIVAPFGVDLIYSYNEEILYHIKQIDLESIIINMITNAFEQVKGKTKRIISIEVKQSLTHVILLFEDSGDGVPKGKEKDIFRPFETTKEEGIGLGLNIVKDIVENYKGVISVERSENLLGAKFVVSLPKGR